jgi:hypothetical protein
MKTEDLLGRLATVHTRIHTSSGWSRQFGGILRGVDTTKGGHLFRFECVAEAQAAIAMRSQESG